MPKKQHDTTKQDEFAAAALELAETTARLGQLDLSAALDLVHAQQKFINAILSGHFEQYTLGLEETLGRRIAALEARS